MENSFLGKEGKLTLSFIAILSIFLLVLIFLSPEVPAVLDEGGGDGGASPIVHKECVDGICMDVPGSGRNTCKYNSQCTHKECVNGRCESVIGQRSDMCHYQSDCKDEEKCSCMACVGGCDPGCKMQTFYGDDCPCSDDCSECGGEGPEEESEEEEQIPVSEPTGCPSKYQYECYSPYFCPQGHQCISGGKTYCDIKCKKICSMEYADEEIKNKYKIIWCRKDTTCPCQEKVGGDFGCFSSGESCYGAIKGCIPSEPTPPELEPPEPELCVKEGKKGSVFNADPNDDVCCAGLEKVQDSYPIEEGVYYPMKDLYTIKKSLYYPTKECLVYKNNFVCTKCGDGKCGLGENYCNCPKDCKEWTICTDSDGGKDYYVKGEITGELMSGEGSPSVDMCIDWGNDGNDNIVRELFCNDQGKGEPTLYECPYGCEDGACICDMKDTLAERESKTYTINGFDYNVYAIIISNIYPYLVKFKVNGETTDAMQEGHKYKFADGAELAVIEILQSEAGDGTGDLVEFCLNGKTSEEPTERITIIGNYIILNENFPDDVYSSPIFFYTGVLPTGKIVRTLINFDLSSLEGKEIRKTELVINKISMLYEQEYGKQLVGVHKVTGPWDTTTACWNRQPGFDTAIISSKEITENGKYTFDITLSTMDYLIDHKAGLLLKAENEEETNLKKFDNTYLNIRYIEGAAEPKNCGEMGGNCRFLFGCRSSETEADYKCPFWSKCCMPEPRCIYECCSDSDCDDGVLYTDDHCKFPGTEESFCINEECSDECSKEGNKQCYNEGYKVCGNFDSDSCLEWSSKKDCPAGTTCSSGECVQLKSNFCEDYYDGKTLDGFCFTGLDKIPIEVLINEHSAENGILKYTPYDSNIERIIEYPSSIQIIDNGLRFKIDVTLINHGQKSEEIQLNNFKIKIYNFEDINVQVKETLQGGETKQTSLDIDLPTSAHKWLPLSEISFSDNYNEGSVTHFLPRIILYGNYDPDYELPVSVNECGGRKYSENSGVCKDNIFFPSIDGLSCMSDSDCSHKYPYLNDNYQCFEYTCLDMGPIYVIGPRDKEYKVGILPLYVTDSDSEYVSMKDKVNSQIDRIIPQITSWFNNEKLYWNANTDLNFKFNKVDDGCRMTFTEFRQTQPVEPGLMPKSELKQIEEKCVTEKDYDILIISIQRDDYFDPQFEGEAGINYEEIIASVLNPRALLHELFHSFGEHDIYGVESYQWANCYLYNANTGHDWNEEMPHLCKFEAMQLGLIPKFPS